MRYIFILCAIVLGVTTGSYLQGKDARILILLSSHTIEIRVWFMLLALLLAFIIFYLLFVLRNSVAGTTRNIFAWYSAHKEQKLWRIISTAFVEEVGGRDKELFKIRISLLDNLEPSEHNKEIANNLLLLLIQDAIKLNEQKLAQKFFGDWMKLPEEETKSKRLWFDALWVKYFLRWRTFPNKKPATQQDIINIIKRLTQGVKQKNPFVTRTLVLLATDQKQVKLLLPLSDELLDLLDSQSTESLLEDFPNAWYETQKEKIMKSPDKLVNLFARLPKAIRQRTSILIKIAEKWQALVSDDELCNWLHKLLHKEKLDNPFQLLRLYATKVSNNKQLMKLQKLLKQYDIKEDEQLLNTMLTLSTKLGFEKLASNYRELLKPKTKN